MTMIRHNKVHTIDHGPLTVEKCKINRYQRLFGNTLFYARTLWAQRYPDSKVHGANMGPIWGRQDPGWNHVRPMNLAIWVWLSCLCVCEVKRLISGFSQTWIIWFGKTTRYFKTRINVVLMMAVVVAVKLMINSSYDVMMMMVYSIW